MASGNTLLIFVPTDNEPPATSFATFDTRNSHPVLDFDDTLSESAVFSAILPQHYAGGGVTVYLHFSAVAVTGTVGWTVAFERIGDQQQDVDTDSFATAQTVTAVTVPATSGLVDVVNVAVSNGANMDSIAVGELFRIRITRDVANDTAVGDAELHGIEIRET